MTRNLAAAARSEPLPEMASAARETSVAPKLASADSAPVASHVHDLQDLIARQLDAPASANWSPRATIGFVALVCGGFWAAFFLGARLLFS